MSFAIGRPPKVNRRPTAVDIDEALIVICGDLFAAGYDTHAMRLRLAVPEAVCAAAATIARERQRLGLHSLRRSEHAEPF